MLMADILMLFMLLMLAKDTLGTLQQHLQELSHVG